jgi:hypothetical protein
MVHHTVPPVPSQPTFKTYFLATCANSAMVALKKSRFLHSPSAVGLWTPLALLVSRHLNVEFLLIKIWIETFDFIVGVGLLALILHA